MALYRPETFQEIAGQGNLIQFIQDKISHNTFPNATMFVAEEGTGKTTLAKLIAMALNCRSLKRPCYECSTCKEIRDKVIRLNKDTDYIKTLKMSVDGGLDAGRQALAELNRGFVANDRTKVIILEECQEMSNEAQTALLTELEYIPKGVYVIAITTDELALRKDFKSRFVTYHMHRTNDKELLRLLKREVVRRQLNIQGGDQTLKLIVQWSENKPRRALKALEAMGEKCNVTIEDIRSYVDILNVNDIIPIISSLNGSLLIGTDTILNMTIDSNTQMTLIMILNEALRISLGQKSFKLSNEENVLLREAVTGLQPQTLAQLLYDIASAQVLTKQALLAAYIKVHPDVNLLDKPNQEVLHDELELIRANTVEDLDIIRATPPSIASIINSGDICE